MNEELDVTEPTIVFHEDNLTIKIPYEVGGPGIREKESGLRAILCMLICTEFNSRFRAINLMATNAFEALTEEEWLVIEEGVTRFE